MIGDPVLLVRRAGLEGKEPVLIVVTALLGILIGIGLSLRIGGIMVYPIGMIAALFLIALCMDRFGLSNTARILICERRSPRTIVRRTGASLRGLNA